MNSQRRRYTPHVDYAKRLAKIDEKFPQVLEGLRLREKRGMMPPRVIVDQVLIWIAIFRRCKQLSRGKNHLLFAMVVIA